MAQLMGRHIFKAFRRCQYQGGIESDGLFPGHTASPAAFHAAGPERGKGTPMGLNAGYSFRQTSAAARAQLSLRNASSVRCRRAGFSVSRRMSASPIPRCSARFGAPCSRLSVSVCPSRQRRSPSWAPGHRTFLCSSSAARWLKELTPPLKPQSPRCAGAALPAARTQLRSRRARMRIFIFFTFFRVSSYSSRPPPLSPRFSAQPHPLSASSIHPAQKKARLWVLAFFSFLN